MLHVNYAECHKQAHYAECHNAERLYAERRGTMAKPKTTIHL